jgi:hypothetical protein
MIKRRWANPLLFLSSILFSILGTELGLRVYHSYSSAGDLVFDEQLGWRVRENYSFRGYKQDASGKKYWVTISTDGKGFRSFGNPHSHSLKKVFFIGDSFTQALDASDGNTFYSIIGKEAPVEVFAQGTGGYGTLQEYMILDKYIGSIQPDILVWQYSGNDFINNSYELELQSLTNNNGLRRPYLTASGQIVYAVPKKGRRHALAIAAQYSRLVYFILSRIDRLNAKMNRARSVERRIALEGERYQAFRDSVAVTNELMRRVRSRVSKTTKILAFSSDDEQPYYEKLRSISATNGIEFVDGIPQAVLKAERAGLTTRAEDGSHWSELGHEIVAQVLMKFVIGEQITTDSEPQGRTTSLKN